MFARRSIKALCALAVFIGISLCDRAVAADFSCLVSWTGPPTEDRARLLWPSGFRPTQSHCQAALLKGPIVPGDFDRFRSFYRVHHRALHALHLISPGGDAEEGMRIGRMVRRYLLQARAPTAQPDIPFFWMSNPKFGAPQPLCTGAECTCASACGLVWLGSIDRGGSVGLHRPKIIDPRFVALGPEEAGSVYRRVLDEISQYLREMELPQTLIDSLVATSSADIRWVDSEADNGQLEHPASFSEWVDASCGSFNAYERKTYFDLMGRQGLSKSSYRHLATPLSAREEQELAALSEKSTRRTHCWLTKIFARRDSLSPP